MASSLDSNTSEAYRTLRDCGPYPAAQCVILGLSISKANLQLQWLVPIDLLQLKGILDSDLVPLKLRQSFMCLCENENFTTHCKDYNVAQHNTRAHVIAGTITDISVVGAFRIGAGIWYLKKVRAKVSVTCGVQSNENIPFWG
ncbi:hypothetical protein Ahy_A03g011119 [Arachis hypogaea]|uniref:Uncharacterized protein n=1 Tax=Arachis hypogaea TaxID=3818 RepID=A0A445DPP2_ARAHY|nr:hypothetical protein Ahy_A03g011119 [Arachis hypogaea]